MVSKKSSPYSSGYTTHLGTSTNVPQCCDIIGGFAYFKLFEQGTGSYKYPQLVAHRSVVCAYLCSSSQDRPTLYLSDRRSGEKGLGEVRGGVEIGRSGRGQGAVGRDRER